MLVALEAEPLAAGVDGAAARCCEAEMLISESSILGTTDRTLLHAELRVHVAIQTTSALPLLESAETLAVDADCKNVGT